MARRGVQRRGWVVACGIVRRRIVCRRARRWPVAGSRAVAPVARSCVAMFRLVSATSVSLPCPRSGIPKARHLPCPGPTYACRRRRQPLCCEHIFACTPWRFITARPAARLRRIVGPLASRKAVAGQSRQRDIIGHIRAYPGIVRTYSGHFRTFPDTRGSSRAVLPGAGYGDEDGRRVPYRPSPDHVRSVPSCAVWPVAGHGVRDGRPVPYRPFGSRAVSPVAHSRVVTSRPDSATSLFLPYPRSGIRNARHLPCPGPTHACRRRRQPLCCVWFHMSIPWRSIDAHPAARLRRIVGPLIIPLASVRSCLLCYNTQRCDPRSGYAR